MDEGVLRQGAWRSASRVLIARAAVGAAVAVACLGTLELASPAAASREQGKRHCEKGKAGEAQPGARRPGKGRCKGKRPRPPARPGQGGPAPQPTAPVPVAPPSPAPGPQVASPPDDLVVSPDGNDVNLGTAGSPLRTIGRALELSDGGERVTVLPGDYPVFRDTRDRVETVTIRGVGNPTIEGAEIYGGARLTFTGVRFVGGVLIGGHPTTDRPSHDIAIRDSELTSAVPLHARCMIIRSGAFEIDVEDNWFHDCRSGIAGPGYGVRDPALVPHSNNIEIRRNRMERFRADGIAFGHWRDVAITDNLITEPRDPDGLIHNDGIQVFGDSQRVTIARNRITDSGGQLMLIQDMLGTNDDILIRDNLSYGCGTYCWQLGGTTNLRIYGNTVWKTKHGGILLRPGAYAKVANNISDFIGKDFGTGGGLLEYYDHNLVVRTWNTPGPNSLVGVDPRFVDPAAGDYRLQADSPAIGAGSSLFSEATDLVGAPRAAPPALGALEPARVAAG